MGHEKEGEPGIGSMSFSAFGEEEDGREEVRFELS
jgi:hypothetical protein